MDIKYDIIEEIGVLSENDKGWKKELNLISWNGAKPKYDIRDWSPEHEKMGKGVTLSEEEMKKLKMLVQRRNIFSPVTLKIKFAICKSTKRGCK